MTASGVPAGRYDVGTQGGCRRRTLWLALVDADHVAGRIAEGAVAWAPRLVDGLLEDLGAGRTKGFERGVEIIRGEHEHGHDAFGEEFLDGVPVGLGAAGVRRREDKLEVGLGVAAQGDPALAVGADVVPDFEAKGVAVEGEGLVEIVDGDVCVLQ